MPNKEGAWLIVYGMPNTPLLAGVKDLKPLNESYGLISSKLLSILISDLVGLIS